MSSSAATQPSLCSHVLSLQHVNEQMPMGGNLLPSGQGATFRVWAPMASELWVKWRPWISQGNWGPESSGKLTKLADGTWAGFEPSLKHNDRYMYDVIGSAGRGLKRDPYARDLTDVPAWPECECLLYDPKFFPWHDQGFRPPAFHELSIYQFHIGTWRHSPPRHHGTFLDVIENLPYIRSLNVNAIQPLPIVEFPTQFSLGYNGVDYFSPETDYGVFAEDAFLLRYLERINALMHETDPSL